VFDTIAVDGWRLENYRKNPVVLFVHNHYLPPVARSLKEWIEKKQLLSLAEFQPADRPFIGPLAECCYRSYGDGFMAAVSVGFRPIRWSWVEDDDRPLGIEFEEQELLEYSCVPVPANPNALIDMAAKGIAAAPMLDWADKLLTGAKDADADAVAAIARKLIGAGPGDVVLTKAAHDELLAKAAGAAVPMPRLIKRLTEIAGMKQPAPCPTGGGWRLNGRHEPPMSLG
jgi:HK97 family phage prohead protease